VTRRDRIKQEAAKDARTYCDDFPGEAPNRAWAEGARDALLIGTEFDATYWPTFEAMVVAINKRRASQARKRRARAIQMNDEEWAKVVAAAGAEAVAPGTSDREHTPGAWARRVLLREAERVRKEGM
jgi:hypothetical protein